MRAVPRLSAFGLLFLSSACVSNSAISPTGIRIKAAPAAPEEGTGALPWSALNSETFARARAEGRIVLIDGSAGWCHWCRVMDSTTYRDPAVRKLLSERFLPVKVDVDASPDFEARYHDWGWPATVLMTADAEEIGKFRGYLTPEKLLDVLQTAAGTPAAEIPSRAPLGTTALETGPLSWRAQ
jgi:thiol:disulfide interchange protein